MHPQPDSSLQRKKRVSWIVAGSVSLCIALAAVLWNKAFHYYIAHNDYRGDIFRYTYHEAVAPFYMWVYPWSPRYFPVLVAALLLSVYLVFFHERLKHHKRALVFPLLVWPLLALLFAYSGTDERVLGSYAHFSTFANDLHFFNSWAHLLQNYTSLQPQMDVHGQHYPPGFLLLLFVTGITGARLLCYAAGVLSIWLLFRIAGVLQFSHSAALMAAWLLALSPGFLIYPSLDPVVLFTCATLAAFYFFSLLMQNARWVYALAFAACVFIASLLSYAIFMWGLLLLLWLPGSVKQTNIHLFKKLFLALAVFAGLHLLLYATTGFNSVSCFLGSLHRDRAINTLNPFDDALRYLFRSSSVLLGFALSAGLAWPFSGFVKNKPGRVLLLCLVLLACSGLIFGEAERIFLFLLPYAMLAAAGQIEVLQLQQRWILCVCLLFSVWMELQFNHFA